MSKEAPVENSFAFEPVRPSSRRPMSAPPPLPQSASRLSSARASADARFADHMLERLAAGDSAGALLAAESLLVHQPRHSDALDTAQMARSELRKLYAGRLGSLDGVPRVAIGPQGLLALSLDFRAGLLLARADGRKPLSQIVESGGLPQLDALRVLSELFLQRVIVLD